jgi:hypothetical protein
LKENTMIIQPASDLEGGVNVLLANYAQDSSADPKITVAAATEDNVKVTGETIDRQGYASAVFALTGSAVLTEAKTASIAVEYQDSADGSTWNTAVAMQASTVAATGDTGGSTEDLLVELGLNLLPRARYIRFNVTLDLSHTSTDTAMWSAAAILGGKESLPIA